MSKTDRFFSGEIINTILAGVAVIALGAGTAVAAIAVSPQQISKTTLRPLTIAKGVQIARAYGDDDEDCVRLTRRATGPDGKVRLFQTVECAE